MSTAPGHQSLLAARPMLASTLFDAAKAKRRASVTIRASAASQGPGPESKSAHKLRTGFAAVDEDVLAGGICYGHDGIVGIAAEETRVGLEVGFVRAMLIF